MGTGWENSRDSLQPLHTVTQTSLSRGTSPLDSEIFSSLRVSELWVLRKIEGIKVCESGGLWLVHQDQGMWEGGWD